MTSGDAPHRNQSRQNNAILRKRSTMRCATEYAAGEGASRDMLLVATEDVPDDVAAVVARAGRFSMEGTARSEELAVTLWRSPPRKKRVVVVLSRTPSRSVVMVVRETPSVPDISVTTSTDALASPVTTPPADTVIPPVSADDSTIVVRAAA
jgi:hypothetical protein